LIVLDTNVAVRFVVDDDREQADRVERLLLQGSVRLLRTVLLETEWVLRSRYRLSRGQVLAALRGLATLPRAEVEDADRVARALDWFEAGLDFADAMHLAAADDDGTFVTFDQGLIRRAARLSLAVPVREP
jgi:predicted nucleic-acid-binding protein